MMYDLNEVKTDVRELIPVGTPLFVEMGFTPGGHGDGGFLTKTKPTPDNPDPDTACLIVDCTVLRGPYKGRKFWSKLWMEGGAVDEQNRSKGLGISLRIVRRIVESANGLRSDDMTPNARDIRARYNFGPGEYKNLQNLLKLKFVMLAAISKERQGYAQKNEIGWDSNILTIDSKRWPSEHELDNPAKPAAVAAPAAPVWAAEPTPPKTLLETGVQTAVAFTSPAAAPVDTPTAAVAAAKATDGMPKWMIGA